MNGGRSDAEAEHLAAKRERTRRIGAFVEKDYVPLKFSIFTISSIHKIPRRATPSVGMAQGLVSSKYLQAPSRQRDASLPGS